MTLNDNLPLVTVAMVTYNSEKYVKMAIESVLASSYRNFELIISDDCSTDSTWSIIQQYKDSRIIASKNETNIGEYPNRNKCIELANGKYFLFIDGDDVILEYGLETFVRYAETNQSIGMVIEKGYFNNFIFPAVLSSEEVFEWEFCRRSLLTSSFSSNLFVTEVLKNEGKLSEKYKTGDDEIRYRIALNYPVMFIPGWFTWPRETPGQASSKLSNGISFVESYIYLKNIISTSKKSRILELAKYALQKRRIQFSKEYIKAILHLNFTKIRTLNQVKKEISLTALFKKNNSMCYCERYSADNPYFYK